MLSPTPSNPNLAVYGGMEEKQKSSLAKVAGIMSVPIAAASLAVAIVFGVKAGNN